jgi:hypothetical protein
MEKMEIAEVFLASFFGTAAMVLLLDFLRTKKPKDWYFKWKCPEKDCGFLLETDSETFNSIKGNHQREAHHQH